MFTYNVVTILIEQFGNLRLAVEFHILKHLKIALEVGDRVGEASALNYYGI